jgi:hypothetical protein
MPPGKKGKKQVQVTASVTADGVQGNFTPEPRRPLIAHLPIKSTEVLFNDEILKYDPHPPTDVEAFNLQALDPFNQTQETVEFDSKKEEERVAKEEDSIPEQLPMQWKRDIQIYKTGQNGYCEIPETTDIACMWCCHGFTGVPVIMPISEDDGVWRIYGNYCSPECCLADILHMRIDTNIRWERTALLHRLYSNDIGGRIYPAPERNILRLFGGPLTIEQFRATVRGRKVRVDLNIPPMLSVNATLDTKPIDFYDTSYKNTGAIQEERVARAEEGLKLKRTKPLKDKESTLDACMNIEFSRR